jgi:hypothetical protein
MNKVFAIMPFGKQKSHRNKGIKIDFDSIYEKAIKPACKEMNLSVIRADEEGCGGIIHTLMFERLVCAKIAIVDVSNQNANVCYELGFRHCARENHTIIIYDKKSKLPFDFCIERAIPYELNNGAISDINAYKLKEALKLRLGNILETDNVKDSPAFELIDNFPKTELNETTLKIYLEKYKNYDEIKNKIESACNVDDLDSCISLIQNEDFDIKFFACHIINQCKRLGIWNYIVTFLNENKLQEIYFQQQLALAYNKTGNISDKEMSVKILNNLLKTNGETSETYGLLGSIYKRYYETEVDKNKKNTFLDLAIDNYEKGFNLDTTDYYPGINLATLLFEKYIITSKNKYMEKMNNVLEVVKYNVNLLVNDNTEDYWLLATAYETNILLKDFLGANKILELICKLKLKNKLIEDEIKSTYKNLNIIKEIYKKLNENITWFEDFSSKLNVKVGM